MPATRLRSGWALAGLVAGLAAAVAGLALRPPAPRGPDAPPSAFSAARARPDVDVIARAPHPIGSSEQERVRDYLLLRMAVLGLRPQAHEFSSGPVQGVNLLGVLPGADPKAPAVLLMAHYDSVPAGPGAADDGAGVAAVLEIARALKAGGGLRRDVMVLLTDGEEHELAGAKAFFTADPAQARVGVAVNLEARGDRGRAAMFQSQDRAGAMIGALVAGRALAGASSLMPDLYRRLPNDTDLTWALRQGHAGLNYAFFGGFDAYHRPLDTAERLDPGSVQSLGEQALGAARAMAQAPGLPAPAPDLAYADLLGGPILAYPPWAGWIVLALAAGLIGAASGRALRRETATFAGLGAGALAFLGLILAVAAGLWLIGEARLVAGGRHLAPLLRRDGLVLAGLAMTGAGLGLLWFRITRRALRLESLRLGALAGLLALAALLQALAPLDAFVLAWPLLLFALEAALSRREASGLLALLAAAQLVYWTGLLFALVGQTLPVALAPFIVLTTLALLPLAPAPSKTTTKAGTGLMVLGVISSLAALLP